TVTARDSLVLTAQRGQVSVTLVYGFRPDDYQIDVTGQVNGLGPAGGTLLIGMGHGMRQTEADTNANLYDYGVVTKTDESKLVKFSSLDPNEVRTINGPFEWAAVKSKYFVTALLAIDTTAAKITGATVHARPGTGRVHQADVTFGVPVEAKGIFQYRIYAGPMEYPRLRAIGHDFYDINPYGWPGFRTLIRPIAVGARWLLVWMHQHLNLAYGVVLVLFGVMIRVLLWPLNQRGMRASMRMQAIQPEMQRLQEQHKGDPQKLQAEVMGLYKREGVNPFSGCWPMLLPWPVLLALFFVLANTIELRGQSFLWLPDLSLKDPMFILPVLMGMSMFGLNKIGMAGMPPNPQTKMMLYFLPIMMTVMFLNFASGLNLYYFVQNLASIPQQWLLAKERKRVQAQPVVGTKKVEAKAKK
ncbi:MAG TPA: membrane protein insertase YidC, partial [Gemmatimonadales bacterium]|nr:membrane protein insertase YidC [Gemmatimonadales bacterium]